MRVIYDYLAFPGGSRRGPGRRARKELKNETDCGGGFDGIDVGGVLQHQHTDG
jgi:hypothetical protein